MRGTVHGNDDRLNILVRPTHQYYRVVTDNKMFNHVLGENLKIFSDSNAISNVKLIGAALGRGGNEKMIRNFLRTIRSLGDTGAIGKEDAKSLLKAAATNILSFAINRDNIGIVTFVLNDVGNDDLTPLTNVEIKSFEMFDLLRGQADVSEEDLLLGVLYGGDIRLLYFNLLGLVRLINRNIVIDWRRVAGYTKDMLTRMSTRYPGI